MAKRWLNEVIQAVRELGGYGTLEEIYGEVEERAVIDLNSYVDWKAQVRKHIYLHSSDCDIFKGVTGGETDLFYSIEGKGKGCWGLRNFEPNLNSVGITEDDIGFEEGKKKLKQHVVRERNPQVINLAKEKFKQKHGRLFCEICEFDFFNVYGELGEDFIEGHHTIPVSELQEGERTRVEDIAIVCSNCHKMLHRRRPWLTKNQLKELIRK
ncbi:HNH endonuclease [Bacillus nitratireducens]|uniref:HNH endonuclease n=1 Tax=Bacillus nitratireducens TaxID=2026193 RepID=A0ABU6P671_9BACI|nr:HNH endonuclease [Bacillus nitratireducens]